MLFKRKLPSDYPCIYETWKTGESTFHIRDLAPEDDEEAVKLLANYFIVDEVLCTMLNLLEEPLSVRELCEFWRDGLAQRMSVVCCEEKEGGRRLVGLSLLCITHRDDRDAPYDFKGEKWRSIYKALSYAKQKVDCYAYLGTDRVMRAMGLAVRPEYRGAGIGQRLLATREALAISQGVTATASVFTGIASQIPAARNGFETIAEVTMEELADLGLPFPRNDGRTLKYMAKKFESKPSTNTIRQH